MVAVATFIGDGSGMTMSRYVNAGSVCSNQQWVVAAVMSISDASGSGIGGVVGSGSGIGGAIGSGGVIGSGIGSGNSNGNGN